MSIHIGNGNKIKDSVISDNTRGGSVVGDQNNIKKSVIGGDNTEPENQRQSWVKKHPMISGIIIAVIAGVIAGVILKFEFWNKVISMIGR